MKHVFLCGIYVSWFRSGASCVVFPALSNNHGKHSFHHSPESHPAALEHDIIRGCLVSWHEWHIDTISSCQ